MKNAEIHLVTLRKLAATPVRFLSNDFKIAEVNAAKWAVEEIDRLKTKTNRLRDTIRSVADTKLIDNYELYQYLRADDLTKEVGGD